MKALVLSEPLCDALEVQAKVFEHHWSFHVVRELRQLMHATRGAVSGSALSNKLAILMRQGCSTRPGLFDCFRLTPYQIQYTTIDKRYRVTIQQREKEDGVIMIWQIYTRKAGRNSFSFLVNSQGWSLLKEQVSEEAAADPAILGEAGGELIGFFALQNLLSSQSLFTKAVEAHIEALSSKRLAAAAG